MTRQQAVLFTLLAYNAALILIGLWALRRTRDRDDFFLAGRGLGAWVAGINASASASSAGALFLAEDRAYPMSYERGVVTGLSSQLWG